ncbi:long-chain fatty acid--CoA ligase [Halobaculum sp. MBLA0147]|uniref:AMP-dependent synthetase/ligase n=1 Tax=Halobaculum sp. MBLA0147 TaxID=3079934 RepID=UPI00352576A3
MDWQTAEADYRPDPTRDSIAATFRASAREHADRPAQRYKGGVYDRSLVRAGVVDAAPADDYATLTYGTVHDVVRHLSYGFRALGVEPGDRVGLFAHTRMEWAQTDFAVLGAGGVVTTVYTSSSEDQVRYLLDDPDADGVVVENRELLERVLAVEDDLSLEFVVVMDGEPHEREDVYTLGEVHELGVDHESELSSGNHETDGTATGRDGESSESDWVVERAPSDPSSLIYTSGTTGQPKGAVLTNRNFLSNVEQCYRRFGPRPDKAETGTPAITPEKTTLSFLPLAHVFERLSGHFLMFAAGATVAYAESPDTLRDDFQLVSPELATSVPRVYEKLYAAIREQASDSGLKRRIFEWATDVGRRHYRAERPGPLLSAKYALADRLVFSTVKEALGGNVDFFISGGGSLSAELCELFHGMGVPVLEGYGLTETSPVVAVNPPEAPQVGTIGPPVQDVEVRLDTRVAPPDTDSEDVGELLVRGPNVFDGYWEKPEKTEAAFVTEAELDAGRDTRSDDASVAGDGGAVETESTPGTATDADESTRWFRTGDVVEIQPDGYIAFRERAKQLLKLSTGKMVPPGPIEDAFAASELVEQAMVLGDARKFVGALLVPNFEAVRSWAAAEGIDLPDSDRMVCREDAVIERIQREVDAVNEDFEKHEQIKQFRLVPDGFTEDNDLLTPTMKKKRRNIESYYEAEIERLYD